MQEQMIYQGHTPEHVWRALEQRSTDTQRTVTLRCPVCSEKMDHTPQRTVAAFAQRDDTDATTHLHCRACDASVSVFQHRHHTETADTRIIYIAAKGQSRAVARLKMQCLSCGQTLQRDETCTNTCEIQTYLVLEPLDGELYIKRAANKPHVPRETEIPILRTLSTDAPETDTDTADNNDTQPQHQPQHQPNAIDFQRPEHPNAHTDIAGQIVAYLTDAPENTATTGEMIAACQCSREGFNKAIKTLLAAGRIQRIKRGVYQFIHP